MTISARIMAITAITLISAAPAMSQGTDHGAAPGKAPVHQPAPTKKSGNMTTGNTTTSSAAIKRAILARYRALADAESRQDPTAITDLVTDDFEAIDPWGQHFDRDQAVAMIQQQFQMMGSTGLAIKPRILVESMTIRPDGVLVLERQVADLRFTDQLGRHHSAHEMDHDRDFWVHTPDGWKLHRTRSVSVPSASLDGRVLHIHKLPQ